MLLIWWGCGCGGGERPFSGRRRGLLDEMTPPDEDQAEPGETCLGRRSVGQASSAWGTSPQTKWINWDWRSKNGTSPRHGTLGKNSSPKTQPSLKGLRRGPQMGGAPPVLGMPHLALQVVLGSHPRQVLRAQAPGVSPGQARTGWYLGLPDSTKPTSWRRHRMVAPFPGP